MSLSNYPPGVSDNTPGCPWSEPTVPDKEFEVTCSQSLSKAVKVITDNYIPGASGVDYDSDDEGGTYASSWHDPDDTSDTDWEDEYRGSGYHTPKQLIALFKQCLEEIKGQGIVFRNPATTDFLIEECKGWTADETEFIED